MANNTSNRGFAAMSKDEREKIARKGGQASTGSFGEKNGADPSKAGAKGAEHQSTEAKRRGGENSHRNS